MRLPDFSDLLASYRSDFVGRQWLSDRLFALLDERDCRIVVLIAGPGMGKTAFLAHLASEHPDWPRYFIRRDSRRFLQSGDARTFLLTVGGQLAALRPKLFAAENLEIIVRQHIADVPMTGNVTALTVDQLRASPFFKISIQVDQEIGRVEGKVTGIHIPLMTVDDRQYSVPDLQYLGLVYPLKALAESDPKARVVVLVDALDELRYSPIDSAQNVVQALTRMPELSKLENLRFVVSSRPESGMIDELLSCEGARHLCMKATEAENLSDLQDYADAAVEELGKFNAFDADVEPPKWAEKLVKKAAGNFLYLKSVLGPIREAASDPAKRDRLPTLITIDTLPADLSGLYDHFLRCVRGWCGKEFPKKTWRGYLAPVLSALAVAQEPLTQDQLANFANLKIRDVLLLLEELRQFVDELAGPPTRYRIYHTSFAQYLTDPGAGIHYLAPVDCHRQVANAYGASAGSCDDVNLEKIDDYGLAHLAGHLRSAAWNDALHTLVGGRWAGIHEKREGTLAGFLADVAAARSAAEAASDLGLTTRYALFEASVHRLADSLPPALIRRLVEERLWTARQALKVAAQLTDDERRTETLVAIAPALSPDLFAEALALVRSLPRPWMRAEALGALITPAPTAARDEIASEALTNLENMECPTDRARILALFADKLPPSTFGGALDLACAIPFPDTRAEALAALVPHVPADLLNRARAAVDDASGGAGPARPAMANALAAIARRLSGIAQASAWRRTLHAAMAIEDERDRADTLARLAAEWPSKLLPSILHSVSRLADPAARANAVAAFLPVCPARELTALLDAGLSGIPQLPIGTDPIRTRALAAFLPGQAAQPADRDRVLRAAFAESARDAYAGTKAAGLALLIPYVAEGEQDALRQKTLEHIRQPDNNFRRAETMAVLAAQLLPVQRRELIDLASEFAEDDRVRALEGMVDFLAPDELEAALDAVPSIADDERRYRLISSLTRRLAPSSLSRAVAVTRALHDGDEQATALANLARQLPPARCPITPDELFSRATSIASTRARAESLIHLAGWLPAPMNVAAWDQRASALRACDYFGRRQVLRLIAAEMPAPVPEPVLHVIGDFWTIDREEALLALAPVLPPSLIAARIDPAFDLAVADSRGEALARIVPCLSVDARAGVLHRVLDWDDATERAVMLRLLAPVLTPDEAIQTLATLNGAPESDDYARALAAVLPKLPSDRRNRCASDLIGSLAHVSWQQRVEIFGELAGSVCLSSKLTDKALRHAREIEDPITRSKALTALLPGLGKDKQASIAAEAVAPLETVIPGSGGLGSAPDRFEILFAVAAWRDAVPRWLDLFWNTYEMSYAHWRAEALTKLAHLMPEDSPQLLARSIADGAAWVIGNTARTADERAEAWSGLVPEWQQLSADDAHAVWNTGLRALAARPRPEVLLALALFAPIIGRLGKVPDIVAMMNGIDEACRIWP
jgi:hypothetical protein